MKGILCACLLVTLQATTSALAFEEDIHYSTTYVLARAIGWSEADSRTIASANQGVDENQGTVAALEVDTAPSFSLAGYVTSSLHQAEKNLDFHCFSKTPAPADRISASVRKVMSDLFSEVADADEDPQGHSRRLIALGVALHCQQDAYSHLGFGGSCGDYSGSCYGHTYQTLLDQLVFSLLKRHHYNPDHPGVSGRWLLETLQGTARELTARRPGTSARAIPAHALASLADELRRSGIDLPDDVRRECNRYIAGAWLFGILRDGSQPSISPDRMEKLSPAVAGTCKNASLSSIAVVRIPPPRYPQLNPDASPYLVRADGTYRQIRGGDIDASLPTMDFGGGGSSTNYYSRQVKVQLSHWSQVLALPQVAKVSSCLHTATARLGEAARAVRSHMPRTARRMAMAGPRPFTTC